MSKTKGPKGNFRVKVTPRSMTDYGFASMSTSLVYGDDTKRWEDDMQERCKEIADQVRRHADNVAYVAVECDQMDVCQHCGSRWTEASPEYNGGCCDKDEATNPETVAK